MIVDVSTYYHAASTAGPLNGFCGPYTASVVASTSACQIHSNMLMVLRPRRLSLLRNAARF